MKWYLANIWPENFFPAEGKFFGRIQSQFTQKESEMDLYKAILKDNFNWESIINTLKENVNVLNEKFNDASCLQKPKTSNILSQPYGQTYAKKCSETNNFLDEMFLINKEGNIITDEGICQDSFVKKTTDYDGEDVVEVRKAKMVTCGNKNGQKWTYDVVTLHIKNAENGECLERTDKPLEDDEKYEILLNKCDSNNESQKWILVPVDWRK